MNKKDGLVQLDTTYEPVYMKGSISENTLCYSWGSASNGKLGNGINNLDCDDVSSYKRFDLSSEPVNISNETSWFTWQPQPIVSLLGNKIRRIQAGKEHYLTLTSNGKIYTWGDNSKGQLGLDPTKLIKAGYPQQNEVDGNWNGVEYFLTGTEENVIKCAKVPF